MDNLTAHLRDVFAWAQTHTTAALVIVVVTYLVLRSNKKTGH